MVRKTHSSWSISLKLYTHLLRHWLTLLEDRSCNHGLLAWPGISYKVAQSRIYGWDGRYVLAAPQLSRSTGCLMVMHLPPRQNHFKIHGLDLNVLWEEATLQYLCNVEYNVYVTIKHNKNLSSFSVLV